jgi:hypothetical protein
VRLHLVDPNPHVHHPSVEGVLLGWWLERRLTREYRVALPELLLAANARPETLVDARELRIPREVVAFYEVLR